MTTLALATFFYINDPVATMRQTPSDGSPIESQAILSEHVTVETLGKDWSCIITCDGDKGWVHTHSIATRETPYPQDVTISRLAAHLYSVKDTELGPTLTVPYGTKLHVIDGNDPRWVQVALPDDTVVWVQKGDIALENDSPKTKADLVDFAKKFLNIAYTWGGRSSLGYDCSGFVQMLYRMIDVQLPRNSFQQIDDKRFKEISFDELEPGDLVFFARTGKRFGHVGMYIGNGEFIHSTVQENQPWIHISKLTDPTWVPGNPIYGERKARRLVT